MENDNSDNNLSIPSDVDSGSCKLLGEFGYCLAWLWLIIQLGPVALVVQALMGLLVIGALVFKRHRETNRRPWKIWFVFFLNDFHLY